MNLNYNGTVTDGSNAIYFFYDPVSNRWISGDEYAFVILDDPTED